MPYRSAVTGGYVTEEYAKRNPDTTVWEDEPPEDKTDDTPTDTQQNDPKLTQEG
jgi:hypothetical protein